MQPTVSIFFSILIFILGGLYLFYIEGGITKNNIKTENI